MQIPWGVAELEQNYSPNWYHVYRAANLPRAQWDAADQVWREHYAKHRPKLLPGARRVLAQLTRSHALGLVHQRRSRTVFTANLREFDLWDHFAARVCSGDTRLRKPHPAPLRLALRHMGLRPRRNRLRRRLCRRPANGPQRRRPRRHRILGPFPTEKRLRAAKPDLLLESITELPTALLHFKDLNQSC